MNIDVFCAGAAKHAAIRLAKLFELKTGHTINFTFGPVGTLKQKLEHGAAADMAIITVSALQAMPQINPGTIKEIGKVGVGAAVRQGTMLPDISTAASFRQTLLNARSVAYADPLKGATSGIHFLNVVEKLGIADIIKEKAVLPDGFVAETVADGIAELCIQQITEIIPVPGVSLVGPLPSELQKITAYGAAITTTTAVPEFAAEFIDFLNSAEAQPVLSQSGFGLF